MILVTGGAGFIGSNIVAALSKRGEGVVVCDWLGNGTKWKNLARHRIYDLVAPEQLIDWLGENAQSIEGIVHMGAISSTTECDVDSIVRFNFHFSQKLWDQCARNGWPYNYASSAATYGDGTAGFDDTFTAEALDRLHPLNPYGWSKHAFDRRVCRIIDDGDIAPPKWAGLKFFNVYGPNEFTRK
jgi:ADP-L-glycero-D-manno-heptose 6-epimerase